MRNEQANSEKVMEISDKQRSERVESQILLSSWTSQHYSSSYPEWNVDVVFSKVEI